MEKKESFQVAARVSVSCMWAFKNQFSFLHVAWSTIAFFLTSSMSRFQKLKKRSKTNLWRKWNAKENSGDSRGKYLMFVQHTCRLGCVLSLARIARTGTSRPETIDSIVVRFVLQTRKKHHKSREGFFLQCCCWRCNLRWGTSSCFAFRETLY